MLSFYIKGSAAKFLQSLKVFTLAESLGGVESLAEHPLTMTHGSVPEAHRKVLGIDDKFIRLSVGIECEADLLADINQALAKA
jgi:cystathionine beta-lyase/cystathionine gamma-synthase